MFVKDESALHLVGNMDDADILPCEQSDFMNFFTAVH